MQHVDTKSGKVEVRYVSEDNLERLKRPATFKFKLPRDIWRDKDEDLFRGSAITKSSKPVYFAVQVLLSDVTDMEQCSTEQEMQSYLKRLMIQRNEEEQAEQQRKEEERKVRPWIIQHHMKCIT